MHVQVHLLIGECRKSFSIRRIFRLLQQTVHKPHAAVVRRRRSGKIPVIACKAGRKQICAEADVHRRVEQIVESNLLAGRNLGFDPQERLVCDLHQSPCPHLGFRLRLEAAFSTDDGIHLILVHSVLCGILLHQRGIGARICHFLHGAHRVLYEKNTRQAQHDSQHDIDIPVMFFLLFHSSPLRADVPAPPAPPRADAARLPYSL